MVKSCNYCGTMNSFEIEAETGKEYCTVCGHYTGMVDTDECDVLEWGEY